MISLLLAASTLSFTINQQKTMAQTATNTSTTITSSYRQSSVLKTSNNFLNSCIHVCNIQDGTSNYLTYETSTYG